MKSYIYCKRKISYFILSLFLVPFLLVFLSSQAIAADPKKSCLFPHNTSTLQVVGVGNQTIDSIDPGQAYGSQSWQLLDNTCAKLFTYPDTNGPGNTTPIAEVADLTPAQITALGTQTVLTIPIKKGFKFSDGTPVTGASFIRAIQRARALDNNGGGYYEVINEMHVDAQGRLVITLAQPTGDIAHRFAIMFSCAVPVNTPLDAQQLKPIPMAGRYYIDSVKGTSGSYSVDLAFDSIVLKKNKYYGGTRVAKAAQINFNYTPGSDPSGESLLLYTDFVNGCSDLANLSASDEHNVKIDHPTEWFKKSFPEIDYVQFNEDSTQNRVFANCPDLRQVVAKAINRTVLVSENPDADDPGSQYLPPGIAGHDATEPFSLTAVTSALPGCYANQPITILTTTNAVNKARGNDIKQQLINTGIPALNITVTNLPNTGPYGNALTVTRDWDISLAGWIADFPDPVTFMSPLFTTAAFSPGGFNTAHFGNRDADLNTAEGQTGTSRTDAYNALSLALESGVTHTTGAFTFAGLPAAIPVAVWGYGSAIVVLNDAVQCPAPDQFIFSQATSVNLGTICIKK